MITLSTILLVLGIIYTHYIADFIMQDEDWAVNKSKDFNKLLMHTITYTSIWCIVGMIYTFPMFWSELNSHDYFILMVKFVFIFPLITFLAHTTTDYFTSKVTSKKYAEGKFGSSIPNFGFFTTIGFDQCLHYTQLFLTFYLLNVS